MAALPGVAGAQTGAPPAIRCVAQADARGIDAVLTRAGSPLAGQGATFVAEGVAAGIDPRLLLAIAGHETGFETDAAARVIHNPFGLGPGMAFTSDAAAIARAARTLDAYYVQEGRIRIDTIGPKWAPIGAANDPYGLNRNWVPGVSAQFTALGGDPDAAVLIGSQAADCPAAPPAEGAAPAASEGREQASGVAEVTTWGGAALMIALVGYLALRRRRLGNVDGGPDARWTPRSDHDDDPLPDDVALAHAQTAAASTPALAISDGIDEEIVEEAEWTLEEPAETAPDDEPADEQPAIEEEPVVEEVVVEELPEADPADAYWAWADGERAARDEPAEEPAGWAAEAAPDGQPAVAAVAADADPADLADQAAIAADLVPALLDGLLPLERVCDRTGVTPRMLALMRIVADTPLPVTEQAARLGMPRTAVAGLCARLEALGLARREPLAENPRRHAVVLTPAGYELCADSAPALEPARVEAVLSLMTPDERAALLAGLSALASPSAR